VNILALLDGQPLSNCLHQQHGGGTWSNQLARIVSNFWSWAMEKGIFIQAEHITGKENIVAWQNVEKTPCKTIPIGSWTRMFSTESISSMVHFKCISLLLGSQCFSQGSTAGNRNSCPSSWCLSPGLGSGQRVCKSSILPHIQMSEKKCPGKGTSIVMITFMWTAQSWIPLIFWECVWTIHTFLNSWMSQSSQPNSQFRDTNWQLQTGHLAYFRHAIPLRAGPFNWG
jgi:hypothetical protein